MPGPAPIQLLMVAHLRSIIEPGARILVVYDHGHVAAFHALLAPDDTVKLLDCESWLR